MTVFLSEYVLATGDDSVLPGLRRIAIEASEGQSAVGSWGAPVRRAGRLYGYGMMNSPGEVMTIGRERAAKALLGNKEIAVEPFIELLDGPSLEGKLGACSALAALGSRAAPAIPKLRETLEAEDLWLRGKAAEALAAIGEPAMEMVPQLLDMLAKGPTKEDPRAMEQRYLAVALFSSRNGMLRNSLEKVDRAKLLAAVKSGLQNQDGHTRGNFSTVYARLSIEELRPILPAIHEAILHKSPSGIMFDGQIQEAGLDLFSRHHADEGSS